MVFIFLLSLILPYFLFMQVQKKLSKLLPAKSDEVFCRINTLVYKNPRTSAEQWSTKVIMTQKMNWPDALTPENRSGILQTFSHVKDHNVCQKSAHYLQDQTLCNTVVL